MKNLLILLLITLSLNAYADFKVSVVNNVTSQTYSAEFETRKKADKWVNEQIITESWGKRKRWVLKTDQTNCIKERDILPEEGEMYTECKLPDDFVVTYTNITEKVKKRKAKKEKKNVLQWRLDSGEDLTLKELNELLRK